MTETALIEVIGFVAALATLITFAQQAIIPMRVTAIVANVCFIIYGVGGSHAPIVLLHILLLPINGYRLYGLLAVRRSRCAQIRHDKVLGFTRRVRSA